MGQCHAEARPPGPRRSRLAAPLAASAGSGERDAHGDSYLAPALQTAASSTPNADVRVIVHSDRGAGKAQDALEEFADHDSTRLPIVDAAAGRPCGPGTCPTSPRPPAS